MRTECWQKLARAATAAYLLISITSAVAFDSPDRAEYRNQSDYQRRQKWWRLIIVVVSGLNIRSVVKASDLTTNAHNRNQFTMHPLLPQLSRYHHAKVTH